MNFWRSHPADAFQQLTLCTGVALDNMTLWTGDALKIDALDTCRAQAPDLIRGQTWRAQARRDEKPSPMTEP